MDAIARAIARIALAWPTPLGERERDILDEHLTLLADEVCLPSTSSAAGRALAASRASVTRQCERCGVQISGTGKRRYCSDACKSAAWRSRRDQP